MGSNKEVVVDVCGLLKVFSDGTVDRTWTGPPEIDMFTRVVSPHERFINGVATRDVTIDPNTGLAVRIYIPEERQSDKSKLPLLLHFHGGGFCFTETDSHKYYKFYSNLVVSARVVCVSVFLSPAPEHRLPSACEEAYSAYLWLRAIARSQIYESWIERYTDFNRIFLIGDSTGGTLVHHVAARAGEDSSEPMRLAGGVAIHPAFMRAKPSKSFLELPDSTMLKRDMVFKLIPLALPVGWKVDYPVLWPVGEAAPPLNGLKLPPMMVVVAERDLFKDDELEYCEAMKKAGKDIEVVVEPGLPHCYYLNTYAIETEPEIAPQVERLTGDINNFINRH